MDIVQIKIAKDSNTVSYIKIIRDYDKRVSMSEIKKSIEENDFVYSFDLDGRDWMYLENMTEYKWHSMFFAFLKKLQAAGADLRIYINGEEERMELLNNWIHTIKSIADDCEKYPD